MTLDTQVRVELGGYVKIQPKSARTHHIQCKLLLYAQPKFLQ